MPKKRVIAFHEISDRERFKKQIEWLLERYEIVSLHKLITRPSGTRPQIALTFDDGYDSWHTNAAPILTHYNLPAVFFICSGFVGLDTEAADLFRERFLFRRQKLYPLSIAQLQELSSNPLFEIGSHTARHIDLGVVDLSTARREIVDDKDIIETWIGKPIRWFSYPFGRTKNISPAVIHILSETGFEGACTIMPNFWRIGDDSFYIGRDSLEFSKSLWQWKLRLSGALDLISRIKG